MDINQYEKKTRFSIVGSFSDNYVLFITASQDRIEGSIERAKIFRSLVNYLTDFLKKHNLKNEIFYIFHGAPFDILPPHKIFPGYEEYRD